MPKEQQLLALIGPPTCAKSSVAQLFHTECDLGLVRGKDILPSQTVIYEPHRQLIPDAIYTPALIAALQGLSPNQSQVLDNIPRTTTQAKALLDFAKTSNRQITVLSLLLTNEQVIERSQGREVCPTCDTSYHPLLKPSLTPGFCPNHIEPVQLIRRAGDKPETIIKGILDHKLQDHPILELFKHNPTSQVVNLDASGTVRQTYLSAKALLDL